MDKQLLKKSQEEFYYARYTKAKQRELYEKHFKIIHIVSGTSVFSSKGKQVTVKAGGMVFVNRGGFSRIHMYPDKNKAFELLCLNFTDKFLEKRAHTLHPAATKSNVSAFECISPSVMMKSLFASLGVYAQNNTLPDSTLANLKLQECAHILSLQAPELLGEMYRKQSGRRVSLEEFMQANYMHNAPLERFAELSGRSLSTFRREFEQIFGTTPSKWLNRKRLETAFEKITTLGCRPSDIYWELGFETLAHFSRKFKEQYHITLSEAVRRAGK